MSNASPQSVCSLPQGFTTWTIPFLDLAYSVVLMVLTIPCRQSRFALRFHLNASGPACLMSALDHYAYDLFASERIRMGRISLEHRLAVGITWSRQFGFSSVRRVVFAVPEARVGDVFAQPRFEGAHCSRQHVSHQPFLAGDYSEVFVDVSHLRVETACSQVS